MAWPVKESGPVMDVTLVTLFPTPVVGSPGDVYPGQACKPPFQGSFRLAIQPYHSLNHSVAFTYPPVTGRVR